MNLPGRARIGHLGRRGRPAGEQAGEAPRAGRGRARPASASRSTSRISATTPLLITEPEDEQFGPGQSQALYDRLPGPRQLVRFTAAEDANRHCEPMGLAVRDARVFDWLDRYLAA